MMYRNVVRINPKNSHHKEKTFFLHFLSFLFVVSMKRWMSAEPITVIILKIHVNQIITKPL